MFKGIVKIIATIFLCDISAAQVESDRQSTRLKEHRYENKPEEPTSVTTSEDYSKTIETPSLTKPLLCEVSYASDYFQSDQVVKVKTTVENTQCGASKGEYIVRVSTRDRQGELHRSEYTEQWYRSDDQTVYASHTYSMNGNVELVRVRLKAPVNKACVCLPTSE